MSAKSRFPPLNTHTTFAPAGASIRPCSSAPTGAAAAPSATSFARAISQTDQAAVHEHRRPDLIRSRPHLGLGHIHGEDVRVVDRLEVVTHGIGFRRRRQDHTSGKRLTTDHGR